MDSFTHIVLGAAAGEAVLGKKVGNKALAWGAFAGSIPDFDVAVTSFFEPVQSLFVHRGFSHSIVFALLIAPLLGWVLSKIHRDATFRQWTGLALASILIHSTIDCFNTYGTALLEPFSNARLAFDSIGIIDFFLLIPLIVIIVLILFRAQHESIRRKLANAGLIFTLTFVILSVVNKLYIESKIKQELTNQGIEFSRLKTSPLPISNFLWLALAEDSAGYHYGYVSNFDKKSVEFSYIPRNRSHIAKIVNNPKIKELIRFTDGFYSAERKPNGSLWIYDLRFGSMAFDDEKNWYVFSFKIEEGENIAVSRSHPNRSFGLKTFSSYWNRVLRDY